MVLDTSLLNTQQYKVRIKGKVAQSRERSSKTFTDINPGIKKPLIPIKTIFAIKDRDGK